MTRAHVTSSVLGIGVGAALLFGTAACSSDSKTATPSTSGPAATTPATNAPTSAGSGSTTTLSVPENWCQSRMPGELLSAEEAVVRFQAGAICPGYVTVKTGTPITFQNIDSTTHTVVIGTGLTPDKDVVASQELAPGATWVQTYDAPVTYNYFVNGFEGFRGTLEVRAAN